MISEAQSRELSQQLSDSVADVVADPAMTARLIHRASHPDGQDHRKRDWFMPLLAAATVIGIAAAVAVTLGSRHGDQSPGAPISPLTRSQPSDTTGNPSAANTTVEPSLSESSTPEPNQPSPSTSPSTSEAAPAHSSISPSALVLGPDGLGALRLGMTRAQALATGLILRFDDGLQGAPGCFPADLVPGASASGKSGSILLSADQGVESIFPAADVKTAEGIGVGSTISDITKAYPGADVTLAQRAGGLKVPVPGNPKAYYGLPVGPNNRVTRVELVLNTQGCFG